MTINDDLSRWEEPPADSGEQALADRLGDWLECDLRGADQTPPPPFPPGADDLLRTGTWLDDLVASVVEHSGILADAPEAEALPALLPARTGPAPVTLALLLHRELGGGRWVCVGPGLANTIVLRTGDRVRLEVVADSAGHVAVFNVGPHGGLNLLYPDLTALPPPLAPGVPLHIVDIELVPPAGRERLVALWTRVPLERGVLAELGQGAGLERLRGLLATTPPEDWHGVALEVEHGDTW
jgi:hypothetical protein